MHGISFSPEFAAEFSLLESRSEKGNGEARYLLQIIEKAIGKLANDFRAGTKIPKKLWPKEYVHKYGITNLWKINLDKHWRALYTVVGDKAELISIILEIIDHKKYDRKFGYHTS